MPAVVIIAASPLRRAALRALVSDPALPVLRDQADLHGIDGRAEVLLVAGADLIARAFDLAGDDGRLAVVGLVADAETAAGLVPDADVPGWALLPDDATADEVRAAIGAAAAGLGVWPASWSARLAASARPADPLDSGHGLDPSLAFVADGDEGPTPGDPLTPREQDVLDLLAQGLSNRQMAARLGISEHTVKFHIASIYGKLGVSGRAAAVRRALRRGLITI
jgi:DNA-binding CsgD family transcriptional regulator